jgi:hypothetical protein
VTHDLRVICPDKGHMLGWARQRDDGATWEPVTGTAARLPWGSTPPTIEEIARTMGDAELGDTAFALARVFLARCDCGNRDVPAALIASAIRGRKKKLVALKPILANRN